ncbi:MAG: hypothetical protein V4458_11610 [Pseudomonadota bacterium]|nr:hypothetical protein [Afipia sp.]
MALFSIAMEFVEGEAALPVVAPGDVLQLVSGLSADGAAVCAKTGVVVNTPTRIAAVKRLIILRLL